MEQLIRRLRADLAPAGLRPDIGLYDLEHRAWLVQADTPAPAADLGAEGYVFTVAGGEGLLDVTDGHVDLAAVAQETQEWAIEELGHGWPELVDERGAFLALLRPTMDGDRVVWRTPGRPDVPVGRLAPEPIALPPGWGARG